MQAALHSLITNISSETAVTNVNRVSRFQARSFRLFGSHVANRQDAAPNQMIFDACVPVLLPSQQFASVPNKRRARF